MKSIELEKNQTIPDLNALKNCFFVEERDYEKGERIRPKTLSNNDLLGIVDSGIMFLTTINANHQRRIMDYYDKGSIFGRQFLPLADEKLYSYIAKTKCHVTYITYSKLINCCRNNCQKHIDLIDYYITFVMRKSNMHIDILGQQMLRDRLLTYFEYLRIERGSVFTLPISFTDLADYLAVDRSAMMREIKKLNEEKIIHSERHKITLL